MAICAHPFVFTDQIRAPSGVDYPVQQQLGRPVFSAIRIAPQIRVQGTDQRCGNGNPLHQLSSCRHRFRVAKRVSRNYT
jgi:hypothetical protein